MKSPRWRTKESRSSGAARSSSKIIRRYACCAPSQTFWQLTNVKRTGRPSSGAGAVRVRPTRLPFPSASENRYQYSRDGRSPPTRTRQVWSASRSARARASATTRVNAGSSATSTVRATAGRAPPFDTRVQRITLSCAGSPDATPSAKRSRRSTQRARERAGFAPAQAAVAPIAVAPARNARRVMRPATAFGSPIDARSYASRRSRPDTLAGHDARARQAARPLLRARGSRRPRRHDRERGGRPGLEEAPASHRLVRRPPADDPLRHEGRARRPAGDRRQAGALRREPRAAEDGGRGVR